MVITSTECPARVNWLALPPQLKTPSSKCGEIIT